MKFIALKSNDGDPMEDIVLSGPHTSHYTRHYNNHRSYSSVEAIFGITKFTK
jgi:hypothetical protein